MSTLTFGALRHSHFRFQRLHHPRMIFPNTSPTDCTITPGPDMSRPQDMIPPLTPSIPSPNKSTGRNQSVPIDKGHMIPLVIPEVTTAQTPNSTPTITRKPQKVPRMIKRLQSSASFKTVCMRKHVRVMYTPLNSKTGECGGIPIFLTCTHKLCFELKQEKYHFFSSEIFHFYKQKKILYIAWTCFLNDPIICLCCHLYGFPDAGWCITSGHSNHIIKPVSGNKTSRKGETYASAEKEISMFLLTRPTLTFCANPAVFIAVLKENKKILIPTDP